MEKQKSSNSQSDLEKEEWNWRNQPTWFQAPLASSGQSIGVSASASVLTTNTQGWFHLGWTGWISWQSKGLSRVFSTILDVWGWCTGTTQRDGMGREEGGGFRMGNTRIPVVDSFWYMAKPIQYCKVKLKKKKKRIRHDQATQHTHKLYWLLPISQELS